MHRRQRAHGDPVLAAGLDALVGGRSRRLAAAVLDISAPLPARFAFIDADTATPFEVGSVTKALTGMLLADAVARAEIT